MIGEMFEWEGEVGRIDDGDEEGDGEDGIERNGGWRERKYGRKEDIEEWIKEEDMLGRERNDEWGRNGWWKEEGEDIEGEIGSRLGVGNRGIERGIE